MFLNIVFIYYLLNDYIHITKYMPLANKLAFKILFKLTDFKFLTLHNVINKSGIVV
jgi:hypothetical protein